MSEQNTPATPFPTEGPIAALMELGEPDISLDWQGMYGEMGFTEEHIPFLMEILTWGEWEPVHAWRVLGILRAAEAVEALLILMEEEQEDDWVIEEVPRALAMIGRPALRPLGQSLLQNYYEDDFRGCAGEALGWMAKHYPELRGECLVWLERALTRYKENDRELNGIFLAALMDLEAVESMPIIKQAFQDKAIAFWVCGDLEAVEIDLGLREERSTPQPDWYKDDPMELLQAQKEGGKVGRNSPCPCGSGKKYKKCCINKD